MANGGVLRTPYTTARVFAKWAVDLWPYVNGKAIVSGIRLRELDVSDMLDVLHFFFEQDAESIMTGEQAEGRDRLRAHLYSEMYKREYPYGSSLSSSTLDDLDPPLGFDEDMPVPVDPFEKANGPTPVKPFIPATRMNPDSPLPFGSALDAPLG